MSCNVMLVCLCSAFEGEKSLSGSLGILQHEQIFIETTSTVVVGCAPGSSCCGMATCRGELPLTRREKYNTMPMKMA